VLSVAVLAGLLARGLPVTGIVDPRAARLDGSGPLPLKVQVPPGPLARLARRHGIPLIHAPDPGAGDVLRALADRPAEIFLSVCFPFRLPGTLRALAATACLNLHPSPLPAFRGPHPLFWQRRAGHRDTRMTLHAVDDTLDTGDIWAQAPCPLPDGLDFHALNAHLAAAAVPSVDAALHRHATGALRPHPQPREGASYQGAPGPGDFLLDTRWSALHAYNFIRAAGHWDRAFAVHAGGREFRIRRAMDYLPDARLPAPYAVDGADLYVQFNPGVLRVRETRQP